MATTPWTVPAAIRATLQRRWDSGELLAARVRADSLFPCVLALRQPSVAQLADQFEQVRTWIRALEEGEGDGYQIVWREINHRQLGRNRVPDKISIASEDDAYRLIGRRADVRRFDALALVTLQAFPQLREWLARRALVVLEQAAAWERVLICLRWFVAHPRPALYLRQLDIAGVDTKFIEARRPLLAELLDIVLPADAMTTEARMFEARYGLLAKPATLRCRVLDARHAIGGLTDISVPVAQFAALDIGVERIFITENEINFLAFPDAPSALVIFGGGYGIDRIDDIDWLDGRELVYWGDIDTHGFAILDRLRARFAHVRSLMMDAGTLHAHRHLWGQEDAGKRFLGDLQRLSVEEATLFDALRSDQLGERVRMEQERIGFHYVLAALARLT